MKRSCRKILRNRTPQIARRRRPAHEEEPPRPMRAASNIHYEMASRIHGPHGGGMGARQRRGQRLGLREDPDQSLRLLKGYLPCHESDHVLHLACNILAGGQRFEDMAARWQDESYLNGLGAPRLPDPTTAGDFTRRSTPADMTTFCRRATIARGSRSGACNRRVSSVCGYGRDGYRHRGRVQGRCRVIVQRPLGYAPLIVSLANTRKVLSLLNRPDNVAGHSGSVEWIDRAVDRVSNWARMVLATLAWNLKAWHGLLVPERGRGEESVRMEFRRFLHAILLLPCQVGSTARRVIQRGWAPTPG